MHYLTPLLLLLVYTGEEDVFIITAPKRARERERRHREGKRRVAWVQRREMAQAVRKLRCLTSVIYRGVASLAIVASV